MQLDSAENNRCFSVSYCYFHNVYIEYTHTHKKVSVIIEDITIFAMKFPICPHLLFKHTFLIRPWMLL